jgi:hypothetical protein
VQKVKKSRGGVGEHRGGARVARHLNARAQLWHTNQPPSAHKGYVGKGRRSRRRGCTRAFPRARRFGEQAAKGTGFLVLCLQEEKKRAGRFGGAAPARRFTAVLCVLPSEIIKESGGYKKGAGEVARVREINGHGKGMLLLLLLTGCAAWAGV